MRTSDKAVDARKQLGWVERLDDVIVGAQTETRDSVEPLGPLTRDEHDRQLLAELGSELAADVVTAHSGEIDVQEDEARSLLPRDPQRFFPRRGPARPITPTVEDLRNERPESVVVVDDEHKTTVKRCRSHSNLPSSLPRSIATDPASV